MKIPKYLKYSGVVSLSAVYLPGMAIVVAAAVMNKFWLTGVSMIGSNMMFFLMTLWADYKVYQMWKYGEGTKLPGHPNPINNNGLVRKMVILSVITFVGLMYALVLSPSRIFSQVEDYPPAEFGNNIPLSGMLQMSGCLLLVQHTKTKSKKVFPSRSSRKKSTRNKSASRSAGVGLASEASAHSSVGSSAISSVAVSSTQSQPTG